MTVLDAINHGIHWCDLVLRVLVVPLVLVNVVTGLTRYSRGEYADAVGDLLTIVCAIAMFHIIKRAGAAAERDVRG